MKKILVINSTMISEGSHSKRATDFFVEELKKQDSNLEFQYLDLNVDPVGAHVLTSNNRSTFWEDADKYIDQLKNVDGLIVGSPMTNFNYTATLKNYLDHVLVAGKTFKYKYDGKGESEGLLSNVKVQIINSQGAPKGWYPFGDHTTSLEGTFAFMGMDVTDSIVIAGTKSIYKDLSNDEVLDVYSKEIISKAGEFLK